MPPRPPIHSCRSRGTASTRQCYTGRAPLSVQRPRPQCILTSLGVHALPPRYTTARLKRPARRRDWPWQSRALAAAPMPPLAGRTARRRRTPTSRRPGPWLHRRRTGSHPPRRRHSGSPARWAAARWTATCPREGRSSRTRPARCCRRLSRPPCTQRHRGRRRRPGRSEPRSWLGEHGLCRCGCRRTRR
eukprot:scaffold2802_cov110-Isochrysis_galbana.AAC.11